VDESFADQQPLFARATDTAFWVNKERMQVLTDLYEHHQSLWNTKSAQYMNVLSPDKEKAKDDTGKHWLAWYAPFSTTWYKYTQYFAS